MRPLLVSVFVLTTLCRFAAAQEIYRWVDDKGRVHFSDNLHNVPEQYRSQVEKKKFPVQTTPAQEYQPDGSGPASIARRFVVPFAREGNSIVVEATVNGSEVVKMIVDTGATVTMLPLAHARKLGINLDRTDPVLIGGVGGTSVVPLADIDAISLAGAEVRNLQVVLGDAAGRGRGLLGMDFLSDFRMEIDNAKRSLLLEVQTGEHEGRSKHWWQQKFRFYHAYRRYITGVRNSSKSKAVIDRAEVILRTIDQRLGDLDNRASNAGVPREMRE
jgi:clan AA aspartic protease (TIGR02281 family)